MNSDQSEKRMKLSNLASTSCYEWLQILLEFLESSTGQTTITVKSIRNQIPVILMLESFWGNRAHLKAGPDSEAWAPRSDCIEPNTHTHLRHGNRIRMGWSRGNRTVKTNFEFFFLVWEKPPYAALPDSSGWIWMSSVFTALASPTLKGLLVQEWE